MFLCVPNESYGLVSDHQEGSFDTSKTKTPCMRCGVVWCAQRSLQQGGEGVQFGVKETSIGLEVKTIALKSIVLFLCFVFCESNVFCFVNTAQNFVGGKIDGFMVRLLHEQFLLSDFSAAQTKHLGCCCYCSRSCAHAMHASRRGPSPPSLEKSVCIVCHPPIKMFFPRGIQVDCFPICDQCERVGLLFELRPLHR